MEPVDQETSEGLGPDQDIPTEGLVLQVTPKDDHPGTFLGRATVATEEMLHCDKELFCFIEMIVSTTLDFHRLSSSKEIIT